MNPTLQIQGHELIAVPAVHNRTVFAEQVNRLCQDPQVRPDAVAVELGHHAVAAAADWMRELGVGPGRNGTLPCMLGLVCAGRHLHPRHRATAIRLQQVYGQPLHKLPPDVLRKHLGFCGVGLICLSPVDSIIEAIRSAVEQDLPLYGVDMETFAGAERASPVMEDPLSACRDPGSYIERNVKTCAEGSDSYIDRRREEFMARRLISVLQQHKKVLFTGGIGHWDRLSRALQVQDPSSAIGPPQGPGTTYQRVLVEPTLALQQTDRFPQVVSRYECLRSQPVGDREVSSLYAGLSRIILDHAMAVAEGKEREILSGFVQFLAQFDLLNLRQAPDFLRTVAAARIMISSGFAERLGAKLLYEGINWTTPKNCPNLPVLRNVGLSPEEIEFTAQGTKGQIIHGDGRSSPFYLQLGEQGTDEGLGVRIPPLEAFEENSKAQDSRHPVEGGRLQWAWPPGERLLYGSAYRAMEVIATEALRLQPEPFVGSLQAGVDIKATLRSYSRGENRVQVRAEAKDSQFSFQEALQEPAVFLFAALNEPATGRWSVLRHGPDDLSPFMRDPHHYRQVVQNQGSVFVAALAYGITRTPAATLQPWVGTEKYLHGILLFGNPCINGYQAAKWAESSRYSRFPILRRSDIESLSWVMERRQSMRLDIQDWRSSLIRAAIPYAQHHVVVVAPRQYTVPEWIRSEATARHIRIHELPLSFFPDEHIQGIRRQLFVYANDAAGLEFPAGAEAALGQPASANAEFLPSWLRDQAKPNKNHSEVLL